MTTARDRLEQIKGRAADWIAAWDDCHGAHAEDYSTDERNLFAEGFDVGARDTLRLVAFTEAILNYARHIHEPFMPGETRCCDTCTAARAQNNITAENLLALADQHLGGERWN